MLCIGGCIIPSDAQIVRPFVHVATVVELIRFVDSDIPNGTEPLWLLVIIESNLATMGSIYYQYVQLMFSNLPDELRNSKVVFLSDIVI